MILRTEVIWIAILHICIRSFSMCYRSKSNINIKSLCTPWINSKHPKKYPYRPSCAVDCCGMVLSILFIYLRATPWHSGNYTIASLSWLGGSNFISTFIFPFTRSYQNTLYSWNFTFIFGRCSSSIAAVTSVKYECDLTNVLFQDWKLP